MRRIARNLLRITISILCGAVVLFLAWVWVRSYTYDDQAWLGFESGTRLELNSSHGRVEFDWYRDRLSRDGFLGVYSVRHEDQSQTDEPVVRYALFCSRPLVAAVAPYWLVTLLAATIAVLPWLRWRFSVRRMLVVTTGLAIALGMAVVAPYGDGYGAFDSGPDGKVRMVVSDSDTTYPRPAGVRFHQDTLDRERLEAIAQVKSLKSLHLGDIGGTLPGENWSDPKQLSALRTMSQLEALHISGYAGKSYGWERYWDAEDIDWTFITGLRSLRTLRLADEIPVPDAFFSSVAQLRYLEVLEVRQVSEFSDGAFKALAACRRLRELHIGSDNLTDLGARELVALRNLEDLQLSGTFTAVTAQFLAKLPKLRKLGLDSRRFDVELMKAIAQLPNLEVLSLGESDFGDDEFAALAGHSKLRDIQSKHSRLTMRSLPVLQSMPKLHDVYFDWKSIESRELVQAFEDARDAKAGATKSGL